MGRGRRSEIWNDFFYTHFLINIFNMSISYIPIILYLDRGTGTIKPGTRST